MRQCAITDGTAGTRAEWLVERVRTLARDGVDLLIVREKTLDRGAMVSFTRRVVAAAGPMRVLVAGGQVEVAFAAGAAGVHLPAGGGVLTPSEIREAMRGAYVTQSCHDVEQVGLAHKSGVDAVLFGPVFGKWVEGVEVVPGVGLPRLAAAVAAAEPLPVFALGGIDRENVRSCSSAGVAAIRMFFS